MRTTSGLDAATGAAPDCGRPECASNAYAMSPRITTAPAPSPLRTIGHRRAPRAPTGSSAAGACVSSRTTAPTACGLRYATVARAPVGGLSLRTGSGSTSGNSERAGVGGDGWACGGGGGSASCASSGRGGVSTTSNGLGGTGLRRVGVRATDIPYGGVFRSTGGHYGLRAAARQVVVDHGPHAFWERTSSPHAGTPASSNATGID